MKLAEALKIIQTAPSPDAKPFNVYLACGILPLHLATFLSAHLSKCLPNHAIEIRTGLFGDLPGNLAQMQQLAPHASAVVVEWSDLDPRLGLRRLGGWEPSVLPDIQANVQRATDELLQLLATVAENTPLALCLPTIPLPPISYQPGEQFGLDNLLLEKTIYDFAARAATIPRLKIVSRQRLDEVSPIAERLDVKSDLATGFPFKTAHASEVAELLANLIQPRSPKKGLITDLDDTLWRGLLGEVGVDGINWELDRHSHIHALYQQLLRALSKSGVLLAVASKNDPALVAEAFKRKDLLLPADRFFPVEVSWNPKSSAVENILRAWNIDADAVVFVDDSPLELAEVKSVHPAIECLQFPSRDEQSAYDLLMKLRDLFGKPELLEEDAIRAESVRNASQFSQNVKAEAAQPLETFLAQVKAELTISPVPPGGDPRAFELVNKTNQFNLNGRRLSEVEFQTALNRPGAVSLMVSYSDKFGPLGKIAVLLGEVNASVLSVDTWVMSCRAFSRHIEHRCLEYLFENLNISEIKMDFHPTERNQPIREFLSRFVDMEQSEAVTIKREVFMSRKPVLSHKVNEVSYA